MNITLLSHAGGGGGGGWGAGRGRRGGGVQVSTRGGSVSVRKFVCVGKAKKSNAKEF